MVDEVLRSGGNRDRSQLRLIYNFMTDPKPEEAAEFVKREYGVGGKGFTIDGRDYAVGWDELGMQIAAGHAEPGRFCGTDATDRRYRGPGTQK